MADAVGTEGTPDPAEETPIATDGDGAAAIDVTSMPESAEVARFKELFLAATHTTPEQREAAKIDWALMKAIAEDHESNKSLLNDTAETFARILQKMSDVHSVRYRVKDTWHLIDKIIRKKSEQEEKYIDLALDNYSKRITDLVGLRVLHLFKSDLPLIHAQLNENLTVEGRPVINIRKGDDESPEYNKKADELGMDVKVHPAGYRSVHYIVSSQITRLKVLLEIQVRTIYEEAWSEVDHKVNYPHKCEPVIGYLLSILNRLSGSADEMGDYVQTLQAYIQAKNFELEQANQKSKEDFAKLEELTEQFQDAYRKGEDAQKELGALKAQMNKAKRSTENVSAVKMAASSAYAGNVDNLTVAGSREVARVRDMLNISSHTDRLISALIENSALDEIKKYQVQMHQIKNMGMSATDLQKLTNMTGPESDIGKLSEVGKISDMVKKNLGK
jgi:ppGpp synthetase/RelA/SpoT-type nucleotidyltranferase